MWCFYYYRCGRSVTVNELFNDTWALALSTITLDGYLTWNITLWTQWINWIQTGDGIIPYHKSQSNNSVFFNPVPNFCNLFLAWRCSDKVNKILNWCRYCCYMDLNVLAYVLCFSPLIKSTNFVHTNTSRIFFFLLVWSFHRCTPLLWRWFIFRTLGVFVVSQQIGHETFVSKESQRRVERHISV